jgi:hypothetical protein
MAVDEYVETLPKVKRAMMTAALLLAGGFGGGVTVTTFGIRADLRAVERYMVNDQQEMIEMRTGHRAAINEVRDAVNDLICEINRVPHARCNFWLANGRPDNLRGSD